MAFLPLDGPAKSYSLTVGNTVIVELVSGTPNSDRDVVSIQPLGDHIWVYFGYDNIVPDAATVAADGFLHFKKVLQSYEAGPLQRIYLLAVNTEADVRISERG
jgi:hypothetical protein